MARQLEYCDDIVELLALDGGALPIVLFNGAVCTTTGLYRVTELDVEEARRLVRTHDYDSAVGHEAAAQVLTSILGVEVPKSRIQYQQKVGQKAIALKLNNRAPEGRILTAEEMFEIGFVLLLLQRIE